MANYQEIAETSAAEVQKRTYNEASGMVKRSDFTPAAGTHWALVGCVMDAAFDPATDLDGIIAALEATAAVVLVAQTGDCILCGQTPASLLAGETFEWRLLVSVATSGTRGYGTYTQPWTDKRSKHKVLPSDTKWVVFPITTLQTVDELSDLTTLISQIEGVAGITSAHPLVYGTVPADVVGAKINYEARVRIDAVPVEEP